MPDLEGLIKSVDSRVIQRHLVKFRQRTNEEHGRELALQGKGPDALT